MSILQLTVDQCWYLSILHICSSDKKFCLIVFLLFKLKTGGKMTSLIRALGIGGLEIGNIERFSNRRARQQSFRKRRNRYYRFRNRRTREYRFRNRRSRKCRFRNMRTGEYRFRNMRSREYRL